MDIEQRLTDIDGRLETCERILDRLDKMADSLEQALAAMQDNPMLRAFLPQITGTLNDGQRVG